VAEPKLLHQGEIVDAAEDPRAGLKQQQIETLDRKIREKRAELADMEAAAKSIASRLYNAHLALLAFFEVYETPTARTEPTQTAAAAADTSLPHDATKWNAWKQRLPEPTGRIIDALLIQPLTHTQIATQAQMHPNNVHKYIGPLKNNGLVEKNGNRWSLKRL